MGDYQDTKDHTLPENKTWLRAGEVAAYLDLSKSTVFRLIQRGEIPGRRFGNSIRILRADVLAFEIGPDNQTGDNRNSRND